MKKLAVTILAVMVLAVSCVAMSACDLLGLGGSSTAKYVGKWQFQSLTEADGTEYGIGDYYHGEEANNLLMAEGFSLEIREQTMVEGDNSSVVRMFQMRNWLSYPEDLQGTSIGSWTATSSKITLKTSSATYYGKIEAGLLVIEFSGVYTVYLEKA